MRVVAIIAALTGLLCLTSVAGQAVAQSRSRAPAVSLSEAAAVQRGAATPAAPRRGLRWNQNGRWGLNFNMNAPATRESQWGEVEAGAYYRLNPRLSVGAAAGLDAPVRDPTRAPETDRPAQPRIRLESIFKF